MPDITIKFKDAKAIKLFTDHHNYENKIGDGEGGLIDNPETRLQFAKRTLKRLAQEAILVQKRTEAVKEINVINEGEIEE